MSYARVLLLLTALSALTACGAASDSASRTAAGTARGAQQTDSASLRVPGPLAVRPKSPDRYQVRFTTTRGDFTVEVTRAWSPNGADRFHELITNGFYRGTRFYRVVPEFITQWGIHGDTAVTAAWHDATIPDDPMRTPNVKGTMAFAANGANSRSTEVFVSTNDNRWALDKQGFAPFARVIDGMDVVVKLTAEYGEEPNFSRIARQGNAYLEKWFPALDYVKDARIVTP